MKEFVKTPHYELALDEAKNRVYLKINGFWRNADQVSNYVADWKRVLTLVKPGFTLLTDLTTMLTHPHEVAHVHQQAQELVTTKRLKFTAEIRPKDFVTAMQAAKLAKASRMPMRQFATFEEAENFLDTVQ